MNQHQFDMMLRRRVDAARKTWQQHARSDDPDDPDFAPRLVVVTKRADILIPLPWYGHLNKLTMLYALGCRYGLTHHVKPRALFMVSEAWYAPPTEHVTQHLQQGGSVSALRGVRREMLLVLGMLPDGTANMANIEIVRAASGEASLAEATLVRSGHDVRASPLTAFYDGYRRARAN